MDETLIEKRLTRLETRDEGQEKALHTAEVIVSKHFETVNNFQERIDRMQATLANKDYVRDQVALLDVKLEGKIETLQKLLFLIGVAVLGVELFFRFSK